MCKGWDPGPTGVECIDRNSHSAAPDPSGWLPTGQPHVVCSTQTSVGELRWTPGLTVVHQLPVAGRLRAAVVPRPTPAWGCSTSCLPVELVEARDQSRKPQGPVGLLRVHRVSRGCNTCKLINGVRNQLSHMHTHLCQNGINQLTLRQGKVKVVVAG